jgi:hypothetical protein
MTTYYEELRRELQADRRLTGWIGARLRKPDETEIYRSRGRWESGVASSRSRSEPHPNSASWSRLPRPDSPAQTKNQSDISGGVHEASSSLAGPDHETGLDTLARYIRQEPAAATDAAGCSPRHRPPPNLVEQICDGVHGVAGRFSRTVRLRCTGNPRGRRRGSGTSDSVRRMPCTRHSTFIGQWRPTAPKLKAMIA